MLLTESHKENIEGCLYCYDRNIINAIAGTFGYAGAMSSFFHQKGYKIFDFAKIFTPVTENIKANTEIIAEENGLTIEYIRKSAAFRKDDEIAQILEQRDSYEGLVHIFSVLQLCDTYSPWHDKASGKTFFKNDRTKCLHYHFYFIDKDLGLCFLRVPTIAPFKLIFYFNGHNLLLNKLKKAGIEYQKVDNAFMSISDFEKAQKLSDNIKVENLHKALDAITKRYCPLPKEWDLRFNYTISQVEYALDLIFNSAANLKPLYDNIIKTESSPTSVGIELHQK